MLNQKLRSYIEALIPERDSLFLEMESYAMEHHIPIMELTGIEAMLQILRVQHPEKILEIGTAIGYSALRMADAIHTAEIVTIERDVERYQKAEEYIERSGRKPQITLIKGDALEAEHQIGNLGPYDAVFIDAAKGQYKKFFEIYAGFLRKGGIVITDNVLFKGLVYEEEIESKRTRNLVKKINDFNHWLMSHPDYDTVILPVGDGVAVSKKRG